MFIFSVDSSKFVIKEFSGQPNPRGGGGGGGAAKSGTGYINQSINFI